MIYFAQAIGGGPIKIGCSNNPAVRRNGLTKMFPYGVEIIASYPGTFYTESFLHQCFRPVSVSQEWFAPCTSLWRLIIELEDGKSLGFVHDRDRRGIPLVDLAVREFGSREAALLACGYSPNTTFSDAFRDKSRGGGRAKLAFAIALRDGALPAYIERLHEARAGRLRAQFRRHSNERAA